MPRRNGRSAYYKRLQLFLRFRNVVGERVVKGKVVGYGIQKRLQV